MKLAINGGSPIRNKPFPFYKSISEEEKLAVNRVMDSGKLSNFLGLWHEDFYGGEQVRHLEEEWAQHFNVKHAISVNSCTSGLYCAVGALDIEPGDEIIVPPYTMSTSAMAPLIYGAIPVFADIEEDYYCIDVKAIEKKITKNTKAIIAVDLFGQPIDSDALRNLANKYNLKIIEDAAQSPGASYKGRAAGTLGDIGVFSLNYHKHIHSGEGGIIVTNNDELAERMRLIRNHAESVVGSKGEEKLVNMVGFNYRMTEIQAAICRCQLKKLKTEVEIRQDNANYLKDKLCTLPPIFGELSRPESTHAHYVFCLKFNKKIAGVHRDKFMKAVSAELQPRKGREKEGPMIGYGYVKPLYLLPLFQKQIAFGSKGYPFSLKDKNSNISYDKGICPIVEKLHEDELIHTSMIDSSLQKNDFDDIIHAFEKVWENKTELQ